MFEENGSIFAKPKTHKTENKEDKYYCNIQRNSIVTPFIYCISFFFSSQA